MTILSYIDVRPFVFLAGLPVFILLAIWGCRLAKARVSKWRTALISSLIFTGLFTLFLTGVGPFVNQTAIREHRMTWEIKPPPPDGTKGAEVVLSFVEFPGHFIGHYSDELAEHLRAGGEKEVTVVFEVTSDYGKVRGYNETEIAGLKNWRSDWGYGRVQGTPTRSPWD